MSDLKIEWIGNLEDDCYSSIEEMEIHAHCEALSEIRWRDVDERKTWPEVIWYVCVLRGQTGPGGSYEYLFHSGEHAGLILSGTMARAIAEAIMRAAAKQPWPTSAAT